jgi:hypothetical protein
VKRNQNKWKDLPIVQKNYKVFAPLFWDYSKPSRLLSLVLKQALRLLSVLLLRKKYTGGTPAFWLLNKYVL